MSSAILERFGACLVAVDWMNTHGYTLEEAYAACERGDWLLWFAARVGVDQKCLVLVGCECARDALQFVPDGDDRPRRAIDTAEAWARGEVSIEELRSAAAVAATAATTYSAYAAAMYAIYTASHGAAYAAAAACVAADAYGAADASIRKTKLREYADLVRCRIPWPVVAETLSKQEVEQ